MEDGWLYVEEESALAGTGPPVFHPTGGEFLTDSLDDHLLRRHRFPSGKVIRKLSEADAFPPDDAEGEREKFGGVSQYLSDHRALILSSNYRVWLLDLRAMRIEGEVLLEGHLPKAHHFAWNQREHLYGDVMQFHRLKGGRLLTEQHDWIGRPLDPEYTLRVWDASSICEEMRGPDGRRPYIEAFFSHFLR
jgi:hypothetical protein